MNVAGRATIGEMPSGHAKPGQQSKQKASVNNVAHYVTSQGITRNNISSTAASVVSGGPIPKTSISDNKIKIDPSHSSKRKASGPVAVVPQSQLSSYNSKTTDKVAKNTYGGNPYQQHNQ